MAMIDWKALIDAGFGLPEGLSQQAAVDELAAMLGDPDPVVLVVPHKEAVKMRIGEVLRSMMPYAA